MEHLYLKCIAAIVNRTLYDNTVVTKKMEWESQVNKELFNSKSIDMDEFLKHMTGLQNGIKGLKAMQSYIDREIWNWRANLSTAIDKCIKENMQGEFQRWTMKIVTAEGCAYLCLLVLLLQGKTYVTLESENDKVVRHYDDTPVELFTMLGRVFSMDECIELSRFTDQKCALDNVRWTTDGTTKRDGSPVLKDVEYHDK